MAVYFIGFISSLILTLALTPGVRRLAVKWKSIDLPQDKRRIHAHPTPRMGWVALFAACALTLLLIAVPYAEGVRAESLRLSALIFLPSALSFGVGWYDDLRGAREPWKLLLPALGATALYAAGLRVERLALAGWTFDLPAWVGFALTLLWVVGVTNAFNLIDGLDGLAVGASMLALLAVGAAALVLANPGSLLLAAILLGGLTGFLCFNAHPASIFLGDSGSLWLGFMTAALALAGACKGGVVCFATPVVVLGLPMVEAGLSLLRRFIGGKPLLPGDCEHIHHILLRRGLTHRSVVSLLWLVCLLFALIGVLLLVTGKLLSALLLAGVGGGIIAGIRQLRYPELIGLGTRIRLRIWRSWQA